ncbi:MAG: hypothetical protein JWL66_3076 [Sphingomonadales bacterium]|nr:hypothetical protein [Sphingomonadales bacterium]
MEVSDIDAAKRCLTRVGYYRLSGYSYPLRQSVRIEGADGKQTDLIQKEFREGTRFSVVSDLYVFDKKLRLIMLDAIERIEVSMKVQIAGFLGARNPTAHLEPLELHGGATIPKGGNLSAHDSWMQSFQKQQSRSREDFKAPFWKKHPGVEFPIWMAIEFWDFGLLSKFLSMMKYQDRVEIALIYGVANPELFSSWVRATNQVRNTCAHHSRLWNKPLVERPKQPKQGELEVLDHILLEDRSQTRLYAVAVVLQFLLRTLHPNGEWAERLKSHCETFPTSSNIDLAQAGFPHDWQSLPVWN